MTRNLFLTVVTDIIHGCLLFGILATMYLPATALLEWHERAMERVRKYEAQERMMGR